MQKRISTSIILNSIPLATNPNGALLLTWLVDSSNLPGRYGLLANRFIPHIAHLCTHKLASLTVLRIITQTTEPQASTNLVQAIFTSTNDQTLIEILSDANNGNQVIGKIIAVNTIAEDQKKQMVEAVRRVLPNIKASTTPPYRMLLEAVGLPVPAGYVSGSPFGRNPTPQWQPNRPQQFSQAYYPYHQPVNGASYQAVNGLGNLSPLLIPQTMPLGQMRGNPQPGKSPRTPAARQGRLSSPGSMMSPASDPFNPFASPSIDVQYPSQGSMRMGSTLSQPPVTFEQQPAIGGLGMGGQEQGGGMIYYGQQSSGW